MYCSRPWIQGNILPKGLDIQPQNEYTFALNGFVPPPSEMTYLEYQMVEEGVTLFGEKRRVDIDVK